MVDGFGRMTAREGPGQGGLLQLTDASYGRKVVRVGLFQVQDGFDSMRNQCIVSFGVRSDSP